MSMQLVRENIEMERISSEGSVQALIEGGVMLPSPSRDAVVLYADARLELGSVEVQTDRVALDGQAYFTLLYTAGEDARIRSVETALSFSHILDVPDAGPKMGVEVQGNIEHVEAEIIGGKAMLRAVAALRARAQVRTNVACVTQIEGVEDLQTIDTAIKSLQTVAHGEGRVGLEERFELPYGLESEEALFARPVIRVNSTTSSDGCVDISGEIIIDAYHSTAMFDRPLARTRHSIPFDASVDAPGSEEGLTAQADVEARDIMLTLDQIEDEKYLTVSLTLGIKVCVQDLFETEALLDAYTANDEMLTLKTESMTVRTGVREEYGEDSVKSVVTLGSEQQAMGVVLAAFARPAMWELSSDSRTHAEGVMEATVIYNPSGGDHTVAIQEEIPFRASFDFMVPEGAWCSLNIIETEAIQITGERLELKCAMALSAKVYEHNEQTVALDAEMAEESQPAPGGVTLYFTQPGDTMWSVAKRFRTTRDSLKRFNPEITELTGDERILLYKRITNA